MTSNRDAGASRLGGDEAETANYQGGYEGAYPAGSPTQDLRPAMSADTQRIDERVLREQQVVREAPVNVNVPGQRGDQVRWGPVWAGLIVALPTFLLLELAFFALGWLDLGQPGNQASLVSGLIGLFAFFLGGLTAGATAMWRGLNTGLLHGILVWALGVVAFLFLTLFGGGALLGTFGTIAAQVVNLNQLTANAPEVQAQQAIDTARDAASWAVLGLGLSIVASALGGVIGAKIWPRKKDTEQGAMAH